jgi:hypothetical protein
MIRKEFIFAGLLVAAGVGGGLWLLPESEDVARMEVRDFNYSDPQQHYETLFNEGDHSTDVVQQLVRIHTNTGDIDRAIVVLEVYVKEHPEDEKALQQLGDLYQFAQRYDDYMVILEARAKENETVIVLQEMAELYNFFQQQEKQKEALGKLYLLENGKNPKTLHDLAMFAAVDEEYERVAKWLDELLALDPAAYTQEDVIRHVNALLEQRKPEEALEITRKWHKLEQSDSASTAKLIDMLHYQGGTAYARQMLDTLPESEIRGNAPLMQAWLLVLVAEGQTAEAYKELVALEKADQLPDMLAPDFIYMAAAQNDMARFSSLNKRWGLARVPEGQLADIWINARRERQKPVLEAIRAHLKQAPAEQYTLMRALVMVYDRSPNRHKALDGLLTEEMGAETVLRLAQANADMGDKAYARKFLARLPNPERMNDSELEALENLYLTLGDTKGAKAFVAALKKSGRIANLDTIGLRTAATVGDAKLIRNWHVNHPEQASDALLEDLFYIAANNNRLALATELAGWQKNASQASRREAIADIYTRQGKYADALALLEQAPAHSERAKKDRVFLLSKLAPKSPQYRAKLNHVVEQWFTSGASRSLKEALVYALIDVGGEAQALPYMRKLADQYGGEWLLTYADNAEKQGQVQQAAIYRIKAAQSPDFDAQTKLGLAYALADKGYSVEAQKLLVVLTKQPETKMAAMQQLVYLWGVRPNTRQLDWLTQHWRAAQGGEKAQFAELLSGRIPPDTIVAFVRGNADLRSIPAVNNDYLQALAAQGLLAEEVAAMAAQAQQSGDVRPLVQLGQLAYDYGDLPQARQAYDAALNTNPADMAALTGATITADAQADYAGVQRYFEQYLVQAQQGNAAPPNAHEAYFAYAEMLRRNGQLEQAKPYYAQAVEAVKLAPARDARTLSIAAQSSDWQGKRLLSDRLFGHAFEQYPNNGILHADRAALLIEHKQYEAARAELASIDRIEAAAPRELQQPLVTSADTADGRRPELVNARQLLVRTAPESAAPRYWLDATRAHSAVEYVTEGYDTVLVVTKPGHTLQILDSGSGWAAEALPAQGFDLRSERAQLKLRRQLLEARMELEEGNVHGATTRVAALEKDYGSDPQYRGFAANTYFYAENWPVAKQEVAKAQAMAPNNADVARLARDIDREHADRVRADVTLVNRGDNTEVVTALSGEKQVSDKWRAGAVMRNHNVDVDNRLQPDGTIRGQSADRQSGEIYGIFAHNQTNYSTLRVFANNDTLGLGADHTNINPLGITTFSGRWHEPYFTFVEGIYDDAVRDRLAVYHQVKRSPWDFGLGASLNNYSIDSADDVFTSFGLEGNLVYALRQAAPYVGLGYSIDAEYKMDDELQRTSTGTTYRRFPLRTREIHFASVTLAEDFGPRTFGSLLAGYGWDRYGGDGPSVEGRIQHNIYQQWDVGARAFYGLDARSSDSEDLSLLNAYIQYRF